MFFVFSREKGIQSLPEPLRLISTSEIQNLISEIANGAVRTDECVTYVTSGAAPKGVLKSC